jgi:kynureninase
MDERLEKALEFSNYMVTLNNQKRLLAETYQQNLIHFYDGSQFTITRELITFVSAMVTAEQDEVVITDDNNIPCLVKDLSAFYEEILEKYTIASNDYHTAYLNLKTSRSVEKLVDYE